MAQKLVHDEMTPDGAWVHTNSTYDETVALMIEANPKAVEFIRGLYDGITFVGGFETQFAYQLVKDYLNKNFENQPMTHSR